MINKISFKLALVSLLFSTNVFAAVDFYDPNTEFFTVENFPYPDNGNIKKLNVSGYYSPSAGGIPARVFMLPRLAIDESKIKVIGANGNNVSLNSVTDASEVSVIKIPVSYTGSLPYNELGSAISSKVSSDALDRLRADIIRESNGNPWIKRGMPLVLMPTIKDSVKVHEKYIAKQKKYIDKWNSFRTVTTSVDGLDLYLKIDDAITAKVNMPGSAILTAGQTPYLNIIRPDNYTLNRIKGKSYEVSARFSFKDAKVKSISATYDFSSFMSSYAEQIRTVTTQNKKSGWNILGIGKRKSSLKQFVNESSKNDVVKDSKTNTVIEMVDADDDMIKQFESQFFPELSKTKTIELHISASKENGISPELAKAHLDYAAALSLNDKTKEIDAVGAAAALATGDYLTFIAKGVGFHKSNDKMSSSFHRIVTQSVKEGKHKNWSSSRTRSVKRKVTLSLIPKIDTVKPYLGICSYGTFSPNLNNGQSRNYVFPSCIEQGGPAHKAGVKIGQIFTKLNKVRIRNANSLIKALKNVSPGDTIKAFILNNPTAPKNNWQYSNISINVGAQ